VLDLAHSIGEGLEDWLRELAKSDSWATCVLAVYYGLPESVMENVHAIWELTGYEQFSEFREHVLNRKPVDALGYLLGSFPDMIWEDVGQVQDSVVTAYLRRLQQRRSLGLYARATAELAIQGDGLARMETLDAMIQGRNAWVCSLSPGEATVGYSAEIVPFWLGELESNFVRIRDGGSGVFGALLRAKDAHCPKGATTAARQLFRVWNPSIADIKWSKVLRGFVAIPRK
jgi:hypothetical protein